MLRFKMKFALLILAALSAFAQAQSFKVHVNQIGFAADAQKLAVYNGAPAGVITIRNISDGSVNQIVTPQTRTAWTQSGETAGRLLDISHVTAPGHYAFFEGNTQASPVFQIGVSYDLLTRDALRYYYIHRAATAIVEPYAEGFARAAGHANVDAEIISNATWSGDGTGAFIPSFRGWYDAGDYGRYMVNSGISTYTLLALYERYGAQIPNFNIPADSDIPALPQLLAEIKWNLDWMLTMQDETDGGVRHKMTSRNFAGGVSPANDNLPLVVTWKTTAATLNFAAVMAVASRVYAEFDAAYANRMLNAAKNAWAWAAANPSELYNFANDARCTASNVPTGCQIGTATGQYKDNNVNDEFFFAAAALATVTSGAEQEEFVTRVSSVLNGSGTFHRTVAGWQTVGSLGTMEVLRNPNSFSETLYNLARTTLLTHSDQLMTHANHVYSLPFGNIFYWGSNSVAANHGVQFLEAYALTDSVKYKNAAQSVMDYLLGRNPLDYSYVTGHGTKYPQNPHDRMRYAYTPPKTVPGMLVGGPANTGCDGGGSFTTNLATRYEDDYNCYGYNEITINWNAPLAYLSAALSQRGGAAISRFEPVMLIDDFDYDEPLSKLGELRYIFTVANGNGVTTVGNDYLGEDESGNDLYAAINPNGYIELINVNLTSPTWEDWTQATIAVETAKNGTDYNLANCADGFRYRFRGSAHRFSVQRESGGRDVVNFIDIPASADWTTISIAPNQLVRDIYDAAYLAGDTLIPLNLSAITSLRWTIRPVEGAAPGAVVGANLQVDDCYCLGTAGAAFGEPSPPEPLPPPTSILSDARDVPAVNADNNIDNDETAIVAPVSRASATVTVGPNPADRQSGVINFYVSGMTVSSGTFTIYDASGNVVRRMSIDNNVTAWDLTDARGRTVSDGSYLVRGTVIATNGKREQVSVMVGVQ